MSSESPRPPREDIFRATALELRAGGQDALTLFGHFAVFDEWTEIDSWYEGRFLERVAKGAFRKTFREGREQMRVLLQHGYDPELGDRPIAAIADLREDDVGAYYEAELLDGIPELVIAGLRAGQYGASFRFRVIRELYDHEPGVSDHNPEGLPERTIQEVEVREFGPVTWGAYPAATAQLRSLTDDLRTAAVLAKQGVPSPLERVLELRGRDHKRATAPAPARPSSPAADAASGPASTTSSSRDASAPSSSDAATGTSAATAGAAPGTSNRSAAPPARPAGGAQPLRTGAPTDDTEGTCFL